MNELVQARVNDCVRRQSIAIDSVPSNKRAQLMRVMLKNLEAFPGGKIDRFASIINDIIWG